VSSATDEAVVKGPGGALRDDGVKVYQKEFGSLPLVPQYSPIHDDASSQNHDKRWEVKKNLVRYGQNVTSSMVGFALEITLLRRRWMK